LPPGGCCQALGPDWKPQHLTDPQRLDSGSLQSINTPDDRLLELKLMHRKDHLSLNPFGFKWELNAPFFHEHPQTDALSMSQQYSKNQTLTYQPSRLHQIQLRKSLQAHRLQ